MEIVRDTMDVPALGYCTDDRLKEISFGAWAADLAGYRGPRTRGLRLPAGRPVDVAAPGGETYRDVYRAVVDGLKA